MKLLNKFWHNRLMWWSHKNTFKIQFDVHVECNSIKLTENYQSHIQIDTQVC